MDWIQLARQALPHLDDVTAARYLDDLMRSQRYDDQVRFLDEFYGRTPQAAESALEAPRTLSTAEQFLAAGLPMPSAARRLVDAADASAAAGLGPENAALRQWIESQVPLPSANPRGSAMTSLESIADSFDTAARTRRQMEAARPARAREALGRVARYALPVAAGAAATAAGGIAIQNAMAERSRRQAEDEAANEQAAELMRRRSSDAAREASEQIDLLDSMDAVSPDVYMEPGAEEAVMRSLADASMPKPFNPRISSSQGDILLPDDPAIFIDDMAADAETLRDGFDPVATPIYGMSKEPVFYTDEPDPAKEASAMREGVKAMDADAAAFAAGISTAGDPYNGPFPLRPPLDPNQEIDFHTGRPKTFEEQVLSVGEKFGAPLPPRMPGAAPPPPPPRRTVTPLRQHAKGMWYQ
jgi:hypothetical protein